jgi:hypothetical protein
MKLGYCDICGMPVKNTTKKETISNTKSRHIASSLFPDMFFTDVTDEEEDYMKPIDPRPRKKARVKYIINLPDVCETCQKSFELFCKKWEKIRKRQTKKYLRLNEI